MPHCTLEEEKPTPNDDDKITTEEVITEAIQRLTQKKSSRLEKSKEQNIFVNDEDV